MKKIKIPEKMGPRESDLIWGPRVLLETAETNLLPLLEHWEEHLPIEWMAKDIVIRVQREETINNRIREVILVLKAHEEEAHHSLYWFDLNITEKDYFINIKKVTRKMEEDHQIDYLSEVKRFTTYYSTSLYVTLINSSFSYWK